MNDKNLKAPIEIAEDIFWVGTYIEDDIFQCHSYLIRDKEESVLIDPGSLITFEETLKKIRLLIELEHIKYIICHHQDPDLAASLPGIEKIFPSQERYIITHWRTYFLLKHYNLHTPFYLVDQHDFKLKLKSGRELKFIETPYMHFPGNIVTYDIKTKVLFSSDIFGGWVEDNWNLFAQDESYLESIKPFHEIYMPSKEIVLYNLAQIKKLDIQTILPQHGSIIKGEYLVKKAISALENFEYGKMFEVKSLEAFKKLALREQIISKVKELIVKKTFLSQILKDIYAQLSSILSIKDLVVTLKTGPKIYMYSKDSEFLPQRVQKIEFNSKNILMYKNSNVRIYVIGEENIYFSKEDKDLLRSILFPLFHVANREKKILRMQELKRTFKNRAYIDNLTRFYRRDLLSDILEREFHASKRYGYHFSVLMLDLDDFKLINDTYGHQIGDRVLKEVAASISKILRKSDIAIRYGGEEFLIILPYTDLEKAKIVAEKIRKNIEKLKINGLKITISIGISDNSMCSDLEELIKRADESLYIAKKRGKNRVVIATYEE